MPNTQWQTIRDDDDLVDVYQLGPRLFGFAETVDMWAATGDESGDRYAFEAAIVDLDSILPSEIEGAIRSCGWLGFDPFNPFTLAECCWSYGLKAPIDSGSGGNRRVAHRTARRAVRSLADPAERDAAMQRPVNAIGSTASEFMRGDFVSAVQRGCESGDPNARLLAKMHGAPQGTIDDVRPADWLPYFVGYMDGKAGSEPDDTDPDLAPEYHRGFERGRRVAAGEAPAPSWIR